MTRKISLEIIPECLNFLRKTRSCIAAILAGVVPIAILRVFCDGCCCSINKTRPLVRVLWTYAMHAPSALDRHTFKHEVGHNLGAHHDMLTFYQDGSTDTVDFFAKAWVMLAQPGHESRTVMAYRRLCKIMDVTCSMLPVFSNPLQSYFGMRRGDPEPGFPAALYGPADNKTAINRMAMTVANYR